MRYLLLLTMMFILVGCSQEKFDLENINVEQCIEYNNKHRGAYFRFMENDDLNELLYIFEDKKSVIGLKTQDIDEAYRFIWLRSFHSPVLIDVTIKKDEAILDIKVTENSGCMYPVLSKDETIKLTQEQLQYLRNTVKDNPFWQSNIPYRYGIRDGSDWIIELRQQGVYYYGKQCTPQEGDPFLNIGRCLLELSKYDLSADGF